MTPMIFKTVTGLQLLDEGGLLIFSNDRLEKGINIGFSGSFVRDISDRRTIRVDGRDAILDLAEWFLNLEGIIPETTDQRSAITTYTKNEYEHVVCIAIEKQESLQCIARIVEELEAEITSISESLRIVREPKPRVEMIAFGYPLGIEIGLTPMLLAIQTYERLTLFLDDELRYQRIPIELAPLFGEFVFDGLENIKNYKNSSSDK